MTWEYALTIFVGMAIIGFALWIKNKGWIK